MAWEKKYDSPKYVLYKDALIDGLGKVGKYYSHLNEKPSFVLALSKALKLILISKMYTNATFIVLHLYYKLTYIKHSWSGPKDQAAEIEAGNPFVKDWKDEAKKIVERTISYLLLKTDYTDSCKIDVSVLYHSALYHSASNKYQKSC